MVTGWRRAFCTSIPKDHELESNHHIKHNKSNTNTNTPRTWSPRLKLFSSSSSSSSSPFTVPYPHTPSLSHSSHPLSTPTPTTPQSVTTKTKTKTKTKTPRLFSSKSNHTTVSAPSSPSHSHSRSPASPFSLLFLKNKSTTPTRCSICNHLVKSGQGTAIFTAECSHSFHFPCLQSYNSTPTHLHSCPLCGSHWHHPPFLPPPRKSPNSSHLRLYDDDEPFMSPLSAFRFNPILESHEEEEDDDAETDSHFPGFFSDPPTPRPHLFLQKPTHVNVTISPEAAVVAVGRSYETYAVLLTVTAPVLPSGCRRPPVDLVTVLDVGSDMTVTKLHALKTAMRTLISTLSSNDRLSIVGFSSSSKRLLPLRRMTPSGRRSARRIIQDLIIGQGSCVNDALRKAAKVIHDRKEKSHFPTILLLEGGNNYNHHHPRFELISSTRFSHLDFPVHTFRVGEQVEEEELMKSVNGFLSVVVLDLRIQLGLASGSAAAQIAAVYSCTGRPGLLNSSLAKLGDMYSGEERELLLELKVPAASIGSNHLLSIRCFHKEASTKQLIYGGDQSVLVPPPHTIRSSHPTIQRLRSLFVMTRAVAESRILMTDRNDLIGAERLLASAKAVLGQPSLKFPVVDDYRRRVEAELAELRWRRHCQEDKRRREKDNGGNCCVVDQKGEPLTPTSAWKAAERLAKVAIMRKSLNRVSDLHGFEDARF